MLSYRAPLEDYSFILNYWLGAPDDWLAVPQFSSLDAAAAGQMLEQAARFATDVLLPLDASGDVQGCLFEAGQVYTPPRYREAYRAFIDAGWPALACAPDAGGLGLPQTPNAALNEMLSAGSHAWTMCPGLAHGAFECLRAHGRPELRQAYLPKIVSGEWLATMCLTEPASGSDEPRTAQRSFGGSAECSVENEANFASGGA